MLNEIDYHSGASPGSRSFTPDCGRHTHSIGFTHESRKPQSNSRSTIRKPKYSEQHERYLKDSWEELVESTPSQDAGVSEVRTWILKVFHRRCHPDPQRALSDFYWKGCDLHSQRRYLALRLRFRREPYGYMIAHDIHDALQESRKRAYKREKEARKQIRQGKRTGDGSASEPITTPTAQSSHPRPFHVRFRDSESQRDSKRAKKTRGEQAANVNNDHEPDTHHAAGEAQLQSAKTSTAKAKKKLAKIFTPTPGPTSPETTATATPTGERDPFRDPSPERSRAKSKTKKKKAKKKKKKGASSPESLDSAQDPFRDPLPMRVVDADDFRLEDRD